MATKDEIIITQQPWADEYPDSPQLGEDVSALAIALRPARHNDNPTVALLGTYNLLGPHAERFSGRVRGAVRIVAINATNGRVFHNHAARTDSVPFELEEAFLKTPSTQDSKTRLVSTAGHFNIDLCEQLGLPPGKARYSVFAWLGDMVSSSVLVQVPANPNRLAMPWDLPSDDNALRFRASTQMSASIKGGIALIAKLEHPGAVPGPHLYGVADSAVLDPGLPKAAGTTDRLVVLVKWSPRHTVVVCSAPLPKERPGGSVHFDLDLTRLLSPGEILQPAFAVAWLGGVLSPVAIVPHSPLP